MGAVRPMLAGQRETPLLELTRLTVLASRVLFIGWVGVWRETTMAADPLSGPEVLCVCCKKVRGSYRDLQERLWCPVCLCVAVTGADPDAVAGETLTIAEASGLLGKGRPREVALQECVNAAAKKREHIGMALACFTGFLGFEGTIGPKKTKLLCSRPQLPFRGRALVVRLC